jgi:myosin protein heavy chain
LDPPKSHKDADVESEVEALESELDDANKEIARLNLLLSQSPARKAIEKAKDTKIEMLEKEKEDLSERVRMLRNMMNEMGSSNRLINGGTGISPIHRQVLSMSMRAPRTPGAPLQDVSPITAVAKIRRLTDNSSCPG